jgi:hypothetical protein
MTGGLLQMVTSGKQDIYLTINPQITFFKKVFRRHTNFSLELKEIMPEQTPEYNNIISFKLDHGDIVHRCYLEVELPKIEFSDKYITESKYFDKKKTNYQNLDILYNKWNNYYINLKGFVDIELQLYRNIKILLQTDNISINIIKDESYRFNLKNKTQKDNYKNKIEETVFNQINISGYISSINKLLTVQLTYDSNIYISKTEINDNLDNMYETMIKYLTEYNNNKVEYYNLKNDILKSNQINFNYAEYLGHNFFQYFSLELGGLEAQKYFNDILHINQMHYVKPDEMDNYLEMIGHTNKLTDFNSNSKPNTKILVPLIFWFNKDAGSGLPLVSLQYSDIYINAKINDIKKIICFENYEKMYDDLLIVKVKVDKYILNDKLIYYDYSYNIDNKEIIYRCEYINDELLKIQFSDLSSDEINTILVNNGTEYTKTEIYKKIYPNYTIEQIVFNIYYPDYGSLLDEIKNQITAYFTEQNELEKLEIIQNQNYYQYMGELPENIVQEINNMIQNKIQELDSSKQYIIDKYQWVGFMMILRNINEKPEVNNVYNVIAPKVASYYPYINFNLYYSLLPNPKVKLICESVFLDDVERAMFANSKLEYVIENLKEDLHNIKIKDFFEAELSTTNPCKELLWYIQPQLFYDGLSENGQNISLLFDTFKYFQSDVITKQKLTFNQLDVLVPNVDWNYYTNLLSYAFLNNTLTSGVYYRPFCLYPEQTQPSGTVNLREIKGKQYRMEINREFIKEYNDLLNKLYKSNTTLIENKKNLVFKFITKVYDLFVVHKGTPGLLFSSY